MQETSGDPQWGKLQDNMQMRHQHDMQIRHHQNMQIRQQDIQMRDNGHSRHAFKNLKDAESSDEENRPPPEKLEPSKVVVMAREAAAQRRSRSMDEYLHIPHADETESEPDSVASSPKVG